MPDSKNKNSDQELVQEFSQLISSISKEVTGEVVRNTAIKQVEALNLAIAQLERKSPELLEDIKTAKNAVTSAARESQAIMKDASGQAQKVLGGLSQQIDSQNTTLAQHLQQAAKKYDELSKGSYDAYCQAMTKQTRDITATIIDKLVADGNINTSNLTSTIHETGSAVEKAVVKEIRTQSEKVQNLENTNFRSQHQQLENMEGRLNDKLNKLAAKLEQMDTARQAESKRLAKRTAWILFFNIALIAGLAGAFYWRYFM